ncbi:MAG: c-type cytochrome [Burkholderiales bacterium]|jgi:cytochrome c553
MTYSALALPGLLFALLTPTAFAVSEATPAKPDLARGEAIAASCSACHTHDGRRGSPTQPILAGQHPEYLVKQLTEFKAVGGKPAKRENAIMAGISAALSEADMKNVAAFYGSKKPVLGTAQSPELAALGEKIYRGGIASRSVPSCSGCHSPNGAGIPAQYPRLAGQHADYTEAQLKAFRDGKRTNGGAMGGVAANLSDKEIKALADYIAGLR